MIARTTTPFILLGVAPIVAETSSEGGGGVFALFCFLYCCFFIVFGVIPLIGLYKAFEKAGQPGWHALIPILNSIVIAHIVGREWWWGLIPYLNIVPVFELAKAFGRSTGYGVGLILLPQVFCLRLGFGDAQYQYPVKQPLF